MPCEGSSPLARGTLEGVAFGGDFFGLIPARAGNTALEGNSSGCCRAHPRSRGEHSALMMFLMEHLGSSPLARGTRN